MHKIAVFTGDLSFAVRKGIVEIDRRVPAIQWLIVKHSPRKRITQLVRSQVRNVRKNGWRWIPHQGFELLSSLWSRLVVRESDVASSAPGCRYTLESLLAQPNLRFFETPDIHDQSALEEVRRFSPDVGLSLAAPILKSALFDIPRLGTINLHKGKVPDYRGMPPAFWELWNEEKDVGCTVHRVTSGLDKGEVLIEGSVRRQRYSTPKGLQLALDEVGIDLTCDAVQKILSGTAVFRPQRAGGKTYTKPNLKQVAELRRRLSDTPRDPQWFGRKIAKEIYLLSLLCAARVWRWVIPGHPTVSVILYHRVSDELRDSLTVGVEQFDRQMALIRKRCHVLSIEEVVAGMLPTRPSRPLVCITFDDGYKDNYCVARPILLRHQIPAAFFVSTGMVGTSRRFPHDEGRAPIPLENMTWDDLQRMRQEGFTVGSHTVNHIDCAKETEEIVCRELLQSLEALREKLGVENAILAYPFGGRQHMTPERLELVKQAGYAACLSGYGGFNRGRVDPYNVLRCGVGWAFSDLAFRCRIFGAR